MIISFRRLGTLAVAVLLLTGAFATIAYATHSWGGYHWARTANPFNLKLGDNVSTVWDGHLATASSDWSVSSVLDTTVVPGQTDLKKGNCKPTNGRVEVCDKTYGFNGWLGVAQIWISGSHITQGTVKLNDTYFNTSTYNNPNEKMHVMCQEIGHTFGLDHQSTDGSSLNTCMDYFSNTGANAASTLSTHPNAHDYEQLETIYNNHLDTITTVGQTVALKGNHDDADDIAGWGKSLQKDGKGKTSLYVRDLGRGEKVFTFVLWIE